MSIPTGATHVVADIYSLRDEQKVMNNKYPYRKKDGDLWLAFVDDEWVNVWLPDPARYQKIDKPWSGPEDGLPPVGDEIEIKIDFKKAPPYAIITLTELGVDVQKHTPRFQKAKVLYASSKYLVTESCGVECLTPMSCVEIRAIRTTEQRANDTRETAIREIMDIAQVDCRVTAARLVDAGFKREVV